MASEDSVRTARASSSSTSSPEPPRWPSRRQRGQEILPSDQLVMTTVPSRRRHVARSPLLSGGGVYGPCSSLTRSAWRVGSFLALGGEPGADVLDERRTGDSRVTDCGTSQTAVLAEARYDPASVAGPKQPLVSPIQVQLLYPSQFPRVVAGGT